MMATFVLAIGSRLLREACAHCLRDAGHAVITIDRPLALLGARSKVRWAAAIVDGSDLGLRTLDVAGDEGTNIGVGIERPGLLPVRLPLSEGDLMASVSATLGGPGPGSVQGFQLDAAHRSVRGPGGSVRLSRIQASLLETLVSRAPDPVMSSELLRVVWHYENEDDGAASVLVRSHVRGLRAKLSKIGLADLVRSRRGLGYYLPFDQAQGKPFDQAQGKEDTA